MNEVSSVITQVVSKMANCFNKSKLEGINSLRKKVKSFVHIKNIIKKDMSTYYQAKK